ncbi:MAG TPA: hypothetical protein VLC73_02275 [Burkholderiales bacterium]|nr:hypothetical protein [Burkholderiales bacterium]
MRKFVFVAAVALGITIFAGCAQQPSATDNTVVASEPGKGMVTRTIEVSAQVVGIDRRTRTVTLKGPEGKVADIVAGPEIRNFDQIRTGDMVVVRYVQALSLELRKTTGSRDLTVAAAGARAAPGERPAAAAAGQVTAVADIIAVDPANRVITLKGPRGNIVDLHVRNPDHFKVVKVGDQVDVTYTEAIALSVEPAK